MNQAAHPEGRYIWKRNKKRERQEKPFKRTVNKAKMDKHKKKIYVSKVKKTTEERK
jgi:hypothetical protein